MFYYPAALRRHTGCFSTIWLVATKGIRVTRRDFLKVNVTKTCDDIMDYLLERVDPPRADLPRPRFSLYLSTQLQYGVILVYHRQCAILLEETQYVVDWLLKQKTTQKNDMDDHRPAPLLKDVLSLMEETEGAPDPLFGQMYMVEDLPSPRALLQGHLRDKSPPYLPRQDPTETPRSSPVEDALHRASQETITLRETEPLSVPFTEFEGVELADHPGTIDLLLAETDQFLEGELLRDEPGADLEREQERGAAERDPDRTKDRTDSIAELQPTTITHSSEEQVVWPQDHPHPPLQPPAPPVDQLTPVSAPDIPSPPPAAAKRQRVQRESSPEPVRRRKRSRRQLIFMDENTQLSQEQQQQQISDTRTQTAPAHLLPPPSLLQRSAVDLLTSPATSLLAEELQLLWRRAAVITPVPGSDLQIRERGPESTDSEKEMMEMMEAAEVAEGAEMPRRDESPKEIPRDEAEAQQLDTSVDAVTSLHLEGSDHMEGSREISPVFMPYREGSVLSGSMTILQDIPEEAVPEVPLHRSPEFLPGLVEREEGPTSFQSLLPRGANRRTVSHHFVKLLEDLSSRKLQAEQREPYDDILLSANSGSL